MALKKRKVELFKLNFTSSNEEGTQISFENFLVNYLDGFEHNDPWKNIYLKLLVDKSKYLVFGITTTKMYGIPAKNDIIKHQAAPLPLLDGEGIGYSNVFLFDKEHSILYYEHNQNGLWISKFVEQIKGMEETNNYPFGISISVSPVLRKNAYQRIIEFGFYHQIEMQIAYPDDLIISEKSKKSSVLKTISSNQGLGTEILNIVYKVDARKLRNTLDIKTIRSQIRSMRNILQGTHGANVQKFKVKGLAVDESGQFSRGQNIDLAEDKFSDIFNINEPRVRTDMQLKEKEEGIIGVYKKCRDEIESMFKKK